MSITPLYDNIDHEFNYGLALLNAGKLNESLDIFNKIIEINPKHARAIFNRGKVFERQNEYLQALNNYNLAITLQPEISIGYFRKSIILKKLNKPIEALQIIKQALTITPNNANFYNEMGSQLQALNRYEEALQSLKNAIAIEPLNPNHSLDLGYLYVDLNNYPKALQSFERAISVLPNSPKVLWVKSNILLLMGDYKTAWEYNEYRLKIKNHRLSRLGLSQPQWAGDSLSGKTILIFQEGGLGDIIQLSRYIKKLLELNAQIIIETKPELFHLLATINVDRVKVIKNNDPLPKFDTFCFLMSLPFLFKTTTDQIPDNIPYLHSNESKQSNWKQLLGPKIKPRIGIVWSGKNNRIIDRNPAKNRSIPIALLDPLLKLPYEFHSLQIDIKPEDQNYLSQCQKIHQHCNELHDLSDTAALIENMDLVISIDTSVANLAGALGCNVWVLLPFSADYRWASTDNNKTPWYPTATLFKQTTIGDWESVIANITKKLKHAL